jgi:hypothetical protein
MSNTQSVLYSDNVYHLTISQPYFFNRADHFCLLLPMQGKKKLSQRAAVLTSCLQVLSRPGGRKGLPATELQPRTLARLSATKAAAAEAAGGHKHMTVTNAVDYDPGGGHLQDSTQHVPTA